MAAKYSDEDIDRMVRERKPMPARWRDSIQLRAKRGHKEREFNIAGAEGTEYRPILRQSDFNPLDFSIILAVCPKDSSQLFRLRRYNGKHGEHTNPLERERFYGFHIHKATARYQESGAREDTFAEPTDRYAEFHSALQYMLEDCGFDVPQDTQQWLFGESSP